MKAGSELHRWSAFTCLILAGLCRSLLAADHGSLVTFTSGDVPIIISAPHGGNQEVPGAEPRQGERLERKPGGFVTTRETGTEELAREVADAIGWRLGKTPYLIASQAHRRFIDPNRAADAAFESPAAKEVYDAYHAALGEACREVRKKFHRGLLLDLHGQGFAKDTVFRGTKNGTTTALLRERFGEAAHNGENSFLSRLKSNGWTVHPDPFDGREQPGYTGGYIVQNYGGHSGLGIDAIQLEFGANFRTSTARPRTAFVLAEAVADYATRYLDWKCPAPLEVGVFQGEGASASREKLVALLSTMPRLKLRDLTVNDIRGGRLADVQVLVHPGGSGSVQGKALGTEGRQQVQAFVRQGGGYVGICAGAYLATCDYDWSLHLLDAKVIDRKHWNRGFGTVEIGLTPTGQRLLGADTSRLSIYYHQGPLLAPAENPSIPDYAGLASFETEIAKNGAPPGIMAGQTAIAMGPFHEGRVFCFSPHPERTEGLEGMLLRAVAWSAGDGVFQPLAHSPVVGEKESADK